MIDKISEWFVYSVGIGTLLFLIVLVIIYSIRKAKENE